MSTVFDEEVDIVEDVNKLVDTLLKTEDPVVTDELIAGCFGEAVKTTAGFVTFEECPDEMIV